MDDERLHRCSWYVFGCRWNPCSVYIIYRYATATTYLSLLVYIHVTLIDEDIVLGVRLQSIDKEVVRCKLKSVHVILVIQS